MGYNILRIEDDIYKAINYEHVPEAFGTVWYSELKDMKPDF